MRNESWKLITNKQETTLNILYVILSHKRQSIEKWINLCESQFNSHSMYANSWPAWKYKQTNNMETDNPAATQHPHAQTKTGMGRNKICLSSANSVQKILVFFLCLLFSAPTFSQTIALQTIALNSAFSSPITNESQTGFGDSVLREAFKRIGYKLETTRLPAERALINANLGIDDGDLLRIGGLQKKYPNLIQVPEKVMDMDVMLFTKNKPSFKVDGWKSVGPHSITIMTGWKVFEINLSKDAKIIKTDNVNQLFTMLLKNRTDFVGYSRWSGLGFLKENNINDITLLEPPLVSTGLYTYLHKKHEEIVPRLATAIREMKADGTLQAMFDHLLKPYLPPLQKK